MVKPVAGWFRENKSLATKGTLALLFLVIAVEGYFLYQQHVTCRVVEAQSAKLLNAFLQGDTAEAVRGRGVAIRLQNVRFKWSERVYIDAGNMALRAVPLRGSVVVFDDLETFRLTLQQSVVRLGPDVLQGMFNESIFNYPNSKIRDLEVALPQGDNQGLLRLSGRVNMAVWIPFTMFTRLSVDRQTNTLVLDVDHLKVMGVPATKLLKLKPLHLDALISLPPNQSLMVSGNRIMVKPFALFPPPRISGTISNVTVEHNAIRLEFAGEPIAAPHAPDKNYVYLKGGSAQFGNFRVLDTDVLIVDRNQGDPFVFSLQNYQALLLKSAIAVHGTESVRVTMPDA